MIWISLETKIKIKHEKYKFMQLLKFESSIEFYQ